MPWPEMNDEPEEIQQVVGWMMGILIGLLLITLIITLVADGTI
jgi:hypothetical protein